MLRGRARLSQMSPHSLNRLQGIQVTQVRCLSPMLIMLGIGLALMGAVRGYKTIITMPDKMSDEKADLLNALGAVTVRTPTEASHDDPLSHISVAKTIKNSMKNAIILDQYSNPSNPSAHYEETAVEMINDGTCDGKRINMVVMGAGTGGTITGVAKRFHEYDPDTMIIGVDPKGSILSGGNESHPYQVEGIGYDFIPDVLDISMVDGWERTDDKESFLMARDLIKYEGLLCGGSSGSAMIGAIKAIKKHNLNQPDKRIIVILPDSARNYMSKFVSDDWMLSNEYFSVEDNGTNKESNFALETILIKVPFVELEESLTIQQFIQKVPKGITLIPIVKQGSPVGVVSITDLLKRMRTETWLRGTDPLTRAINKDFVKIKPEMSVNAITRLVATARFAFVLNTDGNVKVEDNNIWTVDSIALLRSQI